MAQLKDLLVTGATRLIGDTFTNAIQITTINAPTIAGGTTYGPGVNDQILKSNGSSVFWSTGTAGTVTSITAGTGLTGGTITSTGTLSLASGVITTTGNYGPTGNVSPGFGSTFTGSYFTVDTYGRLTSAVNRTITIPSSTATTAANGLMTSAMVTKLNGIATGANAYTLPNADASTLGGVKIGSGISVSNGVISVSAANLGLSNALHFIGIATTAISDNSTTDPAISGYTTKVAGDVVIDKDSAYEYVWNGSKWERLGPDSSYKVTQTAVTTATTASTTTTTTFVSNISQDTNGVISYTTKPMPAVTTATTTTAGIVQLSSAVDSTSTALAATPSAVKAAYDLATSKATGNGRIFYGTCATAAGTVDKEVVCTDYDALQIGDIVIVKFNTTNSGAVASLTLNVNGTGALSIKKQYNTSLANLNNAGELRADTISEFIYNGTYWILTNCDYNSTYTITSVWCNTSASTAAKASSNSSYYVLKENSWFELTLRYANSVAGALTLNVNSTGAKPIYINGVISSSSNYTLPAGKYIVYYDGTNYYFRTDNKITANITGNAATADSLSTSGTTSQFWRGDNSWQEIVIPEYSLVSKTANGLCPQLPNETTTAKFLRQDGSWTTIQASTTSIAGIVQLSSATNSTSNTLAATPAAVKAAYDLANSKTSNTGTVTSVAASGSSGITITGSPITTSGTITIGINLSSAINTLGEGTSTANRNDYAVVQYANGGTTTTTYHRRKLSNIFAALNSGDITAALGYTPYNATNPNGYTTNTGTVTDVTITAGTGIAINSSASITTSGTRTISLATVTTSTSTSTTAPSFGGTFTALDSATFDTYGRLTNINTKTVTVPNSTATTTTNGLMTSGQVTSLTNAANTAIQGSGSIAVSNTSAFGTTSAARTVSITASRANNSGHRLASVTNGANATIYYSNNVYATDTSISIENSGSTTITDNEVMLSDDENYMIYLRSEGFYDDLLGDYFITMNTGGFDYPTAHFSQCWGAVWNDYAEYRKDNLEEVSIQKPGRCVKEKGDGSLQLTTERLERGCEVISDTFGFAIGQDKENGYNTPIASNGRVLAYPFENIEMFKTHIGWPVCSGPNGTVSIMTAEEEERYPSRIVGTISEIPDYEEWGSGKVKVNGRVWIRIR